MNEGYEENAMISLIKFGCVAGVYNFFSLESIRHCH